MDEPAKSVARRGIDPLRPSALRVILLLVGAGCCLLVFFVGFVVGISPFFWRVFEQQVWIGRAISQDPTIDFASSEWLDYGMWSDPDFPGVEFLDYAGEAVLVVLAMSPVLLAAVHILIAWLAAGLALRADRRLDLKLGARPALSLAAAVMVRVLFTRTVWLCLACGLVAGVFYLGGAQEQSLQRVGLRWLPLAGCAGAIAGVVIGDVLVSIGAVRRRLQAVAPVEARVCNGCGYSLRGLPASAQACPECGRVLLANRTVVSMVMSPRVWRTLRWSSLAALLFSGFGLLALLAYLPNSRDVAHAWITVRSGWAAAGGASVVAPEGSVVKVTDGVTTAYLSARAEGGANTKGTIRARAIATDPATGGMTRNEVRYQAYVWTPTPSLISISAPVAVQTLHPWGTSCYYARLYAWPPVPISATFVKEGELAADDWAWLIEEMPPAESTASEEAPAGEE